MQGRVTGSWALLALLLVCLHFPGFLARSISELEEKGPQDVGTNLPLVGQPSLARSSDSENAQPKSNAGSNGLARSSLRAKVSPSDASQAAGGPRVQNLPLSQGLPSVNTWPPEGPWPGMAPVVEDYPEDMLLEGPPYFTEDVATPLNSSPLPEVSAAYSAGASPEASLLPQDSEPRKPRCSNLLGALGGVVGQRPPWSLINKLRHPLQPGHPWEILNPGASWGGGRFGTGWGTRPMPLPQAGIWGANNQYPGTSWGNPNRYPGGSWGNANRFPWGSWGNANQYPWGSWGNANRYPGASWGSSHLPPGATNQIPPRTGHPSGSSWSIPAGLPSSQYPRT
ncbi:PREDICTED: uncharacterized protein C6orf15 homolog [Elephantulus edwardii]|uniref:uncharacterized protein C6orf15 homolog n=1 Tax=Elephantulus edwardii TaxID=28737 RepID=UPI0003F07C0A|nr:PREDICTED: uncharacterized protein C6orf15 homolog [Elephantulus edwardii]